MSVERKAIRGVPWTLLTYGGTKLITLGATIVLARLLVPADFGLLTLGILGVSLFNVLRDLGLAGALVVRQDLDRDAQGTILTMMLATGLLMGGVMASLSPLAAELFDEPRLDGILAALSVVVVLGGFSWFYETVMQRELEFRRRFAALGLQSVTYAVIAILLAALGAGAWSLVAGQIGGVAVLTVALVLLAPYRVRPRFDPAVARDVLRTGAGFMAQGGLAVIQQNADYFAVGKALGAGPVGFYSMAYRLSELPYQGITEPIAKVTFPAFARMRHRGDGVGEAFLSTLRLTAMIACPLGVLLSACADPFTRAVFGEDWLGMIGPLSVLGIWGAVRPVQGTVAWLLNSLGEAAIMAAVSAAVLLPLIPALLIAASEVGVTAVAWIMLADMLLSLAALALLVGRRADVSLSRQGKAVRGVVVACVVAWLVARGTASVFDGFEGIALAAAAAAGLAAYTAALSFLEPGTLRWGAAQVARTLGRGPAAAAP